MNIFLAGVHGVGKTFIATKLPPEILLTYTSASTLIKEERGSASWTTAKRVAEVNENQLALAAAVTRRNRTGERLLIDGHFVLLDSQGAHLPIDIDVFESLALRTAILFEDDPASIGTRLLSRDQKQPEISKIDAFMTAEREHAVAVCNTLGIPLYVIRPPNLADFLSAIARTH